MLSRIAESLYWIGRYCERAESTARILDVYSDALLEDRLGDEESVCKRLIGAMGVRGRSTAAPTTDATFDLLARDAGYSGSIVRSLTAAWENARGARETLSSELWESINTTHRLLDLHRGDGSPFARHQFFVWVKDRTAIVAGLTDSSLSHDDAWRFIVLGRTIERVDMTTRMLSMRVGEAWGPAGWVATLRACAGYEAYLRTYRRGVDASRALEFLLLDRMFPRSAAHALGAAEAVLVELDPVSTRRTPASEARRVIGRACAELEFVRSDELEASLPEHLDRLERACAEAHHEIVARYFHASAAIRWSA
jgi:uncharacterized alpha-E superfamily protein